MRGETMKEIKHRNESGSDVVVNCLEEALQEAKSGEIVGVCIVTIGKDGSTGWKTGGLYSTASLVGALEMSKFGILED